jgi:hypothetical protein
MIFGIASLGKGRSKSEARRKFPARLAAWLAHVSGGVLGGAVSGLGTWLLAAPIRTLAPSEILVALTLFLCAAGVSIDLRLTRPAKPGCQVPSTWLIELGPVRSYSAYGFRLGAGLLTHIPYSAIAFVFVAAALNIRSLGQVLLVGATFGVARTFIIGPASLAPATSSLVLYRSAQARRAAPLFSAVTVAAIAGAALASVLTH